MQLQSTCRLLLKVRPTVIGEEQETAVSALLPTPPHGLLLNVSLRNMANQSCPPAWSQQIPKHSVRLACAVPLHLKLAKAALESSPCSLFISDSYLQLACALSSCPLPPLQLTQQLILPPPHVTTPHSAPHFQFHQNLFGFISPGRI